MLQIKDELSQTNWKCKGEGVSARFGFILAIICRCHSVTDNLFFALLIRNKLIYMILSYFPKLFQLQQMFHNCLIQETMNTLQ